jgi:hypothetical protein
MGPRCRQIGQGVRKQSALGLSGKTKRIREMMMIGRRKIKRYVMTLS